MLVQVAATLLGQKEIEGCEVLELQEQQRIFTATLPTNAGTLPPIEWGSRVKIVGVRDDGLSLEPFEKLAPHVSAGALNVLLRSPTDVVVLSGPPWWTLKRTVVPVTTLLVTFAVTLIWVYYLRRRLDRQQASQLAISRQILRSQESERQRIAINLHDSLGQNLLVIKNQACLAMEPGEEEASRQARLNRISQMTSQAIEEVRQITHDLRPYQLDRLGLTQAVRAVVSQVADNSSIVIASGLDDIDGIFDKESEIHVYRLVQEALNNILKHSAASEAAVVVKNRPGLVSLSIRDNGRGFDAGALSRSLGLGYGISGITERVGILGGTCTIDSKPSHGTSVMIEIPKTSKT
jgi:signal transduction histidine kinase